MFSRKCKVIEAILSLIGLKMTEIIKLDLRVFKQRKKVYLSSQKLFSNFKHFGQKQIMKLVNLVGKNIANCNIKNLFTVKSHN